jgi:hypothetical protein
MPDFENQYSAYLDHDTRPMSRFLASEEERQEMPLIGKIGIGVGLGALALTAAHRTGGMRMVARAIEVQGKAFAQAAREVSMENGRGFRNIFSNSFRQRYQTNVAERAAALRQGTNREYDMQRILTDMGKFVDKEIPHHIEESLRYDAIMDDLQRRHRLTRQNLDGINRAFNRIDNATKGGFSLKYASDKDLVAKLSSFGEINDPTLHKAILDSRARFRQFDPQKMGAELRARTDRAQRKFSNLFISEMHELTQKQGVVGRTMRGRDQATVDDVLHLHSAGKMKLDTDTALRLQNVLKNNQKFGKAVFDKHLYVKRGRDGNATDFFDLHAFDEMKESSLEWFATSMLGGLSHTRDILNFRKARRETTFRMNTRGTVQPVINAQRGMANDAYMGGPAVSFNGRFRLLNSEGGDPLEILNKKRKVKLTSSQFGTISRIYKNAAGIGTDNKERGWFKQAFDLGNQNKDSDLISYTSVFTKFSNPEWERNVLDKALRGNGVEYDDFFRIRNYFDKYTYGFSPRVLNQIQSHMPDHLKAFIKDNDINFARDKDMLKLFEYLGNPNMMVSDGMGGIVKNAGAKHAGDSIQHLWRRYERNRHDVLGRIDPIGEAGLFTGEYTRVRTGMDQVNQQVSLEVLRQIMETGSGPKPDFRDLLDSMRPKGYVGAAVGNGAIKEVDYRQAQDLYAYYEFNREGRNIYKATDASLQRVNDLFANNAYFRTHVQQMAKKTNPLYERFSGVRPVNQIGDDYIAVNQAFEEGFLKQFTTIRGIKDFTKQMSWFTGRRNMEDFTTASAYNMFIPYRLQDQMGNFGLGFSDSSMGSAGQLWSSLILKRLLPAVAIPTYAQYIDDKSDQMTGTSISERWEIYKATRELGKAQKRDATGETERMRREFMLHPGIEHFSAMPNVYLPGVGEVGMGTAAKAATFTLGIPDSERDTYSYEEMYDYYQNGVDEVRKGRWWAFGSKTAYRGDRIIEFQPNSYRMAMSDWEYTSVTSTMEERWSHSAFPTLENPLGIGRNLFNSTEDKYWWEMKHYYDRPYMLTGSLFNPNTMFLGDVGNATIGRALKPVREMHSDYWGDPVLMQAQADEYGNRPTTPVMTKVSPGGRMEHVVPATPGQYGSYFDSTGSLGSINGQALTMNEDNKEGYNPMYQDGSYPARFYIRHRYNGEGSWTGEYAMQDLSSGDTIYVPANIAKQNYPAEKLFEMAAAPMPPTPNPWVDTKPRAMFDQEFEYRKEIEQRRLRQLNDPRNPNWQLQEAFENWTEPLGFYKYAFNDEMLGYNPYQGKIVMQKADAATNISNAYWETNMGSLGGSVSEILRRFIRRDDGQLDYYNPIRNTMPNWMPGGDYFINFQTGDPYQKIPHGEYRLPGESYERLNRLHPDETGYYGAFDKFKILADVAPWSDEYKFWKDYVEQNNNDSELRRQAAIIKDQVSKRKQKYEFTDYRFQDQELEKHTVTVTKFLDDYTFMTKEFDAPIRLAGMQYQAKAEGVMRSYFKPGDKVQIGIDADPTRQIADDSYGTMRAVVFKNLQNINQQIIMNGQMKENINDYSAPGVFSRFTKGEIQKGAKWESLAHAESPLNTKFLQVRTALEEYERDQIYGKDWATWENFMISDYAIPAFQSGIRGNVLFAAGQGALFGIFPAFIFGGGKTGFRRAGMIAGSAAVFAAGSMWRSAHEAATGERWIPERRRTEQDLNQYFDVLKYMKFSGLYERAKEELLQQGIDVDAISTDRDLKKEMNKAKKEELLAEKRRLYMDQPAGWEARHKEINAELKLIEEDRDQMFLPSPVLQALEYKDQAETTLYGVDPYEDRMKVMRAMPYKDRWFFNEFANARMEDRQHILDLVPDDQDRIYKAIWGEGLDPQVPLDEYFSNKFLPGPDWAGWRPDVNLEDYQAKAVQQAGLDMSDYNFWDEDLEAAAALPPMDHAGGTTGFRGYRSMQRNIQEVLQGQGLWDVQVTVTPGESGGARINMNYQDDRRREIDAYLAYNMDSIV